jgi:hypothetical protein
LLGKSKAYDSRTIPVQRLAEWSDGEKVNGIAGGVERIVNPQTVSRTLTRLGFGAALESERHEKKLAIKRDAASIRTGSEYSDMGK